MIKLRPYQEEAKRRALEFDGFALFLEQRTGKTPIACSIVQARQPDRLLIACPVAAIPIWKSHTQQFGLKADTRILNFESLWRQRRKLRRWNPDLVIGDETHRIKNRNSKQSRALRMIARRASWKLALTGTPIEKNIQDAWAQFDFIAPEVFGKWKKFKQRYLVMGGFRGKKIIGTRNKKEFKRKFQERYHRVLLEDVKKTPTKIGTPNLVCFNLVESRPAYDSMAEKFMVELADQERIVAPMVISQGMKLQQLAGGFLLDEDRVVHRFGDEKLAHCGALMHVLGDRPVAIVVRFLPELYRTAQLCRALGRSVTLVSGSHPFESFNTDAVVVQIRAGISIDLSRAEDLIFYSWTHSFLDYDQAKFRIRSYHSKRAQYHYLIAKGTVDEDMYETVVNKTSLVSLLLKRQRRLYDREKKG